MKKFIITLILVIFSFGASVYAYDTIDATLENGNIIIEYGDVKAQYISGKENTIISASYDGNGKLVGASFVKQESGRLTVKKVDGAVDVILWFSDFEGDAIFDLNIFLIMYTKKTSKQQNLEVFSFKRCFRVCHHQDAYRR